MGWFQETLNYKIAGVPIWNYLAAFAAVLGGFLLKRVVRFVFARLNKLAQKTRLTFDEVLLRSLEKPLGWGAVLAGLWVMTMLLPFPPEFQDVERFSAIILKGLSIGLVVWIAIRLSDELCNWWAKIAEKTETKLDDQIVPIVRRSAKVFLIIIGGMLVLQNLGYSVGSLLAGVGLGGAALALASKDTVANVFGSLVIFMDQPFQIGDWIHVGSIEGTVEEVGLRTTRVRTFANSLISVPNSMFTTVAVNNWSRMQKRRIKMTVGLTYDTTADQILQAVEAFRDIIANDDRFAHDFYLVTFDSFGSSSLDIFIYCFTLTTNWAEYLAIKQDFLLEIMRTVERLGLSFAYPSQSLYIEKLPGEPPAMLSERPE